MLVVIAVLFLLAGGGLLVLGGRVAALRTMRLPLGLIFITLSALFGLLYTTTLPSSPLRQAETRDLQTRHARSTMSVHTQYFIAETEMLQAATVLAVETQTTRIQTEQSLYLTLTHHTTRPYSSQEALSIASTGTTKARLTPTP